MSSTDHQKSKEDAKKSQSIDELLSEISHIIFDDKNQSKSLASHLEKKFEQLKLFSHSEQDKDLLNKLTKTMKDYPQLLEKLDNKKTIFDALKLFREQNPPITYTPPIVNLPKKEASPKSLLSDVSQGNYFRLKGGRDLKSIKELADAFKTMDMDVYNHHTSSGRNDFSTWIYDLFGNKELADELKIAKNKEEAYEIINKRMNGKKTAAIKFHPLSSNEINMELDLLTDIFFDESQAPKNLLNKFRKFGDDSRLLMLKNFYTLHFKDIDSWGESENKLIKKIAKTISEKGINKIKYDHSAVMHSLINTSFECLLKNDFIRQILKKIEEPCYSNLLFLDALLMNNEFLSEYIKIDLQTLITAEFIELKKVEKILKESAQLYEVDESLVDRELAKDYQILLTRSKKMDEMPASFNINDLKEIAKKRSETQVYFNKYKKLNEEGILNIEITDVTKEFSFRFKKKQLKEDKIKKNLELAQKLDEKINALFNREKLDEKENFTAIKDFYEMTYRGLASISSLSSMISRLETLIERSKIIDNKETEEESLKLKDIVNTKIHYIQKRIVLHDEIIKYVSEIERSSLKLKQPKLIMNLILLIKNEEQKIKEYETKIKELRTHDGALLEPTFALFDEKIKDYRANFTNMQKGLLNKLVEKYSILTKLTSSKKDPMSLEDVNENMIRYAAKSEKVLANIRGFAQLLNAKEIAVFKEFIEKVENETTKKQHDLLYLKARLQDKQKITDSIDAIINEKNTIRHIFSNNVTLDGIKAVTICKENSEKKREEITKYSANKCLKTILDGYNIACDDLDKATRDALENGFNILKKYIKDPLLGVHKSMVLEINPIAQQSKLIDSRKKRLGELSKLLGEFSKMNIEVQNESEEIKLKGEQLDGLSSDLQEILKYNADITDLTLYSKVLTGKIPAVFTWLPFGLTEKDNIAAYRIVDAIKNYRSISEKYKSNEEMNDVLNISKSDLNKIEVNLNKFAKYASLKCNNKYLKIKNYFEKDKSSLDIKKLEAYKKELEQISVFYLILETEEAQQAQVKGLISKIRATIYEWYGPRLEKMEAKELEEIAKKYGVLENGK